MMKLFLSTVLAVCITNNSAWAAEYEIDPSHSSVGFKVKHLAISSVPGKFAEFKGTFSFDPSNIEASKADATITATSIDTGDKKRDDHLRGGDFLDTSAHPAISFKSSKVEKVSDSEFKAHGDLSIHGVTKPVVLDVTFGGAVKDPWGKERAAFVATTKINRKDFGLTWSKVLETGGLVVGDDVAITLEVEGVKKA
jgi:polyisoprenoid-binding protein YceI